MNNLFLRRVLIVFLLVVFLGFGGNYIYRIYAHRTIENERVRFDELIEMGNAAHTKGDYDNAIMHYEKAIAESSTINLERLISVKLRLASDLFSRNKSNDRLRAAEIDKGIVLDTSLDPRYRAIALNNLLELYNKSYNYDFATKHIFVGELFGTFTKGSKSMYDTVTAAYRYSYSLYPSAVAAFRVAHWYGFALQQGASLSFEEKSALLEDLKKWTQNGEALISQLEIFSEREKPAYIYQLNAVARELIGEASPPETAEMQFNFAEDAYKRALANLSSEDTLDAYTLGLYVRYYYALMLAQRYKEARQLDVRSLLAPIVSADDPFPRGRKAFIDSFKSLSAVNCKKDIPLLASFSPEFYQYLASNGAGCP